MTTNPAPQYDPAPTDQPRSILALATVPLQSWKLIAATTILAITAATIVALLRPKVYTAYSTLYLSQAASETRPSGLEGIELPAGLGAMRSGGNSKLINLVANSRSFADSLTRRAGSPLRRRVTTNPDGSVVIQVEDRDPRRAARIAEAHPELINSFVGRIGAQSIEQRVRFLQGQVQGARERLERAEERMAVFQRRQNAPALQEQATRTLDAAVTLQQRVSDQEIAVQTLRRTATADNPRLRAAEAELANRREQLRQITSGRTRGSVFVPLGQSPELQVSSTRLLREFTEAEQTYTSLAVALTQAQITGDNALPVVSVLDSPLTPTQPAGPGLVVIVGMGAVAGMMLGVIVAFLADYLRRARGREENESFFASIQQITPRKPRLARR